MPFAAKDRPQREMVAGSLERRPYHKSIEKSRDDRNAVTNAGSTDGVGLGYARELAVIRQRIEDHGQDKSADGDLERKIWRSRKGRTAADDEFVKIQKPDRR